MDVSELIKSINAAADSRGDFKEDERSNLLAACERLKQKLESLREVVLRIIFAPHQAVALRLGVDMKLFDAAAALSIGGSEVQLEHLASKMAADPQLVTRIVRFLSGMGVFDEIGQGRFVSTPLACSFASTSPFAEAAIHMTSQNEIISSLPSYFEENGYKNPGDAYNGPFQCARRTNLHRFDWPVTKPRLQHAFNVVMAMSRLTHRQCWFNFFPAVEKLRVESTSDTLLVDFGGGIGHDLITFNQAHPTLTGELIVQDIPVVIDSIKDPLPGDITAMFPDSTLLINKNVMSESQVLLYIASTDLVMMAELLTPERTKTQFKALLAEAGFDLVRVWTPPDGAPGPGTLLEAVHKKM